ncbi:MAG: ATP-binding protein [Pseudomonadota bacterium]
MLFSWLKRYMPRSLYGRAALILLVPILTLQLVVSVVFIQRHFEDVTEQMTRNVALELEYLLDQVNNAPNTRGAQAALDQLVQPLFFEATFPVTERRFNSRAFYDLTGRVVMRVLNERLDGITAIDLASDDRDVRVQMMTVHGALEIMFDRRRVSASNPHQLLVLMVFTGLLMTIIAFVFLRNQLRPIKRLARAAEAFGKGRMVPYRPTGAVEVRSAGSAFLDMRNRIERQIEQRTMMLSGVSHDLRTPLTRLKLGLSLMDDAEAAPLRRDVEDMERMLNEFLAFARGDAAEELALTDPIALATQAVEDAQRMGQAVRLGKIEGAGQQLLRPIAVRRAVDNLIGNAVRYGKTAEVGVTITPRSIAIHVEDDGPGIPQDRREEAVKPFSRLEPARNQNKNTGVGLGLSIAADVARAHGGMLRLGESGALGGLQADLVLAR